MKLNYLDKEGLKTLVKLVKKSQTSVYKVNGRAVYADTAFLTNEGATLGIDSVGIWQNVDGVYKKVTSFREGDVYDITNSFTSDANFREGAGNVIDAGTNIVVVNVGTVEAPEYRFDILSGAMNLVNYQTKKLDTAITVFENETPTVYTAAANLPVTEPKDAITITHNMVAILGEGAEKGDIYRAVVTVYDDHNDIAWIKIGRQDTVEGAINLLSNIAPNTPVSDSELEDLWNSL